MKLLWIAKGHLNNDFAGVDGGDNIRIPLIRALADLGVEIDFFTYPLDMDLNPSPIPPEFGIKPIFESAEKHVQRTGIITKTSLTLNNKYDAALLEVRPGYMAAEAYMQNVIIDFLLKHNVRTFLWDQDLWAAESIDFRYRDKVVLLRPYIKPNSKFKNQRYFPYFYHNVSVENREPIFDVVYIGNRYEREKEFVRVMSKLRGRKVLISGDWTVKAPHIVKMFRSFTWLGPTSHMFTIPLLTLGKCTVHFGRAIMREFGLIPIRSFEALMAGRPCFMWKFGVKTEFDDKSFMIRKSANIRLIINSQYHKVWNEFSSVFGQSFYSVKAAAERFINLVEGEKCLPLQLTR